MAKDNFRPTTESTPLNRSPNNLSQMIMLATRRLCQLRCISVHGGLLGTWVKYNQKLFLFMPCLGTQLQVRPVHRFSRTTAQTTRARVRMCYFWEFSHWSPFGGQNAQNPTPSFKAWIGVLKSNSRNRKTRILSKLQHRFQPNFAHW